MSINAGGAKEVLIQCPRGASPSPRSILKCPNSSSFNSYGSHSSKHVSWSKESEMSQGEQQQSDMSPRTLKKIESATKISLLINVILFIIKIAVFVDTGSFAVIAALTDSFCDLVSQLILYCTQRSVNKQHPDFPAGRTRAEPVGILVVAVLMMILSCSVVVASGFTLYTMYYGQNTFEVQYSFWSLMLLISSIVLKLALWTYCRQFTSSPTAMALAEDHRNDVLSNGMALGALIIASTLHGVVWIDPLGGAVISIYIIGSWYDIGIEETNKLLGIRGDKESMQIIHDLLKREINREHHFNLPCDYKVSAYYIGRNLCVELQLIFNPFSHLIQVTEYLLDIQDQLETLDFVERAFVMADYKKRKEPIHNLPMLF